MVSLIHAPKQPLIYILEFIITALLLVTGYQLLKPYFDNILAMMYEYFIQGNQFLTKP